MIIYEPIPNPYGYGSDGYGSDGYGSVRKIVQQMSSFLVKKKEIDGIF